MAKTASGRATDAATMANRLGWAGLPIMLLILAGLLLWPKPTAAQLLTQGETALAKGDWNGAYANFIGAVQTDPKNPSAHLKLAQVYDKTRHYDLEVTELQQAQQLDPASATTAQLNQAVGQRDAEVNLKRDLAQVTALVNEHPDFRNGWLELAYDQYRLKQDQDAKKAAQAALGLDPNYLPTLKLVQLLP